MGKFSDPMDWHEALDSLHQAAATAPPEELPDLLAELERAKATAYRRLLTVHNDRSRRPQSAPSERQEQLLTVEEAAQRLGVKRRWLYDRADSLPFTRRIGARTLRFSERELERYMSNRR